METRHEAEVEEAPKLYSIVVTGSNAQMDPEPAAALEEYCEARDKDPNSWHNNPEKKRKALGGSGPAACRVAG